MEPLEIRRAGLTGCSGELQIVQIFKGAEHLLDMIFRLFYISEEREFQQFIGGYRDYQGSLPEHLFLLSSSTSAPLSRERCRTEVAVEVGTGVCAKRSVVTVPHKALGRLVLCACTVLSSLDHQEEALPLRRSHLKRLSLWEAGMSAERAVQNLCFGPLLRWKMMMAKCVSCGARPQL